MSEPRHVTALYDLLEPLREGELSTEQAERLRALLLTQPDARRIYVQYMQLCADLRWSCESVQQSPSWPSEANDGEDDAAALMREVLELEERASARRSAQEQLQKQRDADEAQRRRESMSLYVAGASPIKPVRHIVIPRSLVIGAGAALAAMLVLLVYVWMRPSASPVEVSPPVVEAEQPPATPVAIARLAEAVDCQWSDPRLPIVAGGQFKPGRLELVKGLARLTFADGADVILEAPCAIELHDPGRAFLHAGRLSAVVPPRARGFAIGAAGVNIIDLGTEFAVSVTASGAVEVHVFKGEVEAQLLDEHNAPLRSQRLITDQAARIDPGEDAIARIRSDATQFVRELTPSARKRASDYARAVLSDRPLAYWPLNDAPGAGHIEDYSGNGFHGRSPEGVTFGVPGAFDASSTAAQFEPEGSIEIGRFREFQFNGAFTLEAWVRIDDLKAPGGWFVSGYVGGNVNHGWGMGYNVLHYRDQGKLHPGARGALFGVQDYAFEQASTQLRPGRWMHWAFTVDSNHVGRFYLNGELLDTQPGKGPGVLGDYTVMLGNIHDAASTWHGGLSDVAIYNRPLSAERIRAHYEASQTSRE